MKKLLLITCISVWGSQTLASSFPGDLEALEQVVRQWVAEQNHAPISDIAVGKLNRNITIQPCSSPLDLSFPFNNRDTVQVSCAETWNLFVKVQIADQQSRRVTTRPIKRGQTIEEADIEQPKGSWLGLVALRDIDSGEPVTDEDLGSMTYVYATTHRVVAGQTIEQSAIEKIKAAPTIEDHLPITNIVNVRLLAKTDIEANTVLSDHNTERLNPVVVATRPLPHGTIIEDELVEIKWLPQNTFRTSFLTDLSAVVGLQTTRQIRPLEPIKQTDITQALLVKKGDAVTLTIERTSIKIEVDTIAIEDGQYRQQIQLKNVESGQLIRGIVVGKNRAKGIR